MQTVREIALFSGKIYTPETNFTQQSVVMVATNLNSAVELDFKEQQACTRQPKRFTRRTLSSLGIGQSLLF